MRARTSRSSVSAITSPHPRPSNPKHLGSSRSAFAVAAIAVAIALTRELRIGRRAGVAVTTAAAARVVARSGGRVLLLKRLLSSGSLGRALLGAQLALPLSLLARERALPRLRGRDR